MTSVIYRGKVRHRRYTEKAHEFLYPLFMFYFDVDNLTAEFKHIAQVSIEKFNWFSFRRKNYLSNNNLTLGDAARELIKANKGIYPQGKIYLLTHLSCLGYCFNPISLYFVFKPDRQELEFLIVEVTNTPWGEKHAYVLDKPVQLKSTIYQYTFKKELHVSPFLTMDYNYQLNLKIDNDQIILHLENHQQKALHFDATLSLAPLAADASVKKTFFRFPLMSYRVTSAIYWQALKLWLKGVSFHAKR